MSDLGFNPFSPYIYSLAVLVVQSSVTSYFSGTNVLSQVSSNTGKPCKLAH